jgi:hypothetical protein
MPKGILFTPSASDHEGIPSEKKIHVSAFKPFTVIQSAGVLRRNGNCSDV